jgi:hypothetical protein
MAHRVKTEDCQLFPTLKDNRYVLLTMVSGMMMPSASLYWARGSIHMGRAHPYLHGWAGSPRVAAIDDEGREVAATIIGD